MIKNILFTLAICAALFACQKNEIALPIAENSFLYAIIEEADATKTAMDENNNIRWSESDKVVAFMKTSLGLEYQIQEEYVGKTYGYFSKVSSSSSNTLGAGVEWDHNVVYYPYSSTVACEKLGSDYVFYTVLPAEQTYAPESFGQGAFPMVAVSEDTDITFKNVCGAMKLQLKGNQKITSIKLQGKNNEKLSGAAVVNVYTDGKTKPSITMASDASTIVTLNCGEGVQLTESAVTEFVISLPSVVFTKGFTVTVMDTDAKVQTIETDEQNTIVRSSILIMPEVIVEGTSGSQSRDYIDEYGINHGQGVKIGEIVWAPVNCGYHDTKFKYGKLYQWGRKYGQGYSGNLYVDGKIFGTYADAVVPTIEAGRVSVTIGNDNGNADVFYQCTAREMYDWVDDSQDVNLWNSGTESEPVKTGYDPCPDGWRVPTYAELYELTMNHSSWISEDSQNGYWFCGASSYTSEVSQVFFPAAGYRNCIDGNADYRGFYGHYWTSKPSNYALNLYIDSCNVMCGNSNYRAYGYSVRCVQE